MIAFDRVLGLLKAALHRPAARVEPHILRREVELTEVRDVERLQARGRDARALLDHPLMVEAFETLRSSYLAGIEATQSHQTTEREALWSALAVLKSVRMHLERVAYHGQISQADVRGLRRQSATARQSSSTGVGPLTPNRPTQ